METRANHLLIGSFVLIVIGVAFGFLIWLAKVDIDREFVQYHVYFEESVAGLSVGGDVRFNGIPVGTVAEIKILQASLNSRGFDAGVVDGIPGRKTRTALQGFQKSQGVVADGYPTKDMLALLTGGSAAVASTN